MMIEQDIDKRFQRPKISRGNEVKALDKGGKVSKEGIQMGHLSHFLDQLEMMEIKVTEGHINKAEDGLGNRFFKVVPYFPFYSRPDISPKS